MSVAGTPTLLEVRVEIFRPTKSFNSGTNLVQWSRLLMERLTSLPIEETVLSCDCKNWTLNMYHEKYWNFPWYKALRHTDACSLHYFGYEHSERCSLRLTSFGGRGLISYKDDETLMSTTPCNKAWRESSPLSNHNLLTNWPNTYLVRFLIHIYAHTATPSFAYLHITIHTLQTHTHAHINTSTPQRQ